MSMSSHIVAFRSENKGKYLKLKKAFEACKEAGIEFAYMPREIQDYFKWSENPEEALQIELQIDVHYTHYSEDMEDGFEVKLTDLPKEVTKLRFYNSY